MDQTHGQPKSSKLGKKPAISAGGPGTLQGGGRSTSHSNTFLHFPPVNTGGVEISDSAKDLSQNFLSTGLRC